MLTTDPTRWFADLKVGDLVTVTITPFLSTVKIHRVTKRTAATVTAGGRDWRLSRPRYGPAYIGVYPPPKGYGATRYRLDEPTQAQRAEFLVAVAATIDRCRKMLDEGPSHWRTALAVWEGREDELESKLNAVERARSELHETQRKIADLGDEITTGKPRT